jgi:predicted SAM-dependent methyltransferase
VAGRQSNIEAGAAAAAAPPPIYLEARAELAYRFLAGDGLEIGGLNWPLQVPAWARVKNVDRMTPEQLREEYAEMAGVQLAEVDILDDGERLGTVPDGSQDFIIANHFLEHTGDPIGTIGSHLAKLKPGGVLFYAVPDKRFTFDFRREVTPLAHMIRDHEEGSEVSRREHYDEWGQLVIGTERDREDPRWPDRAEEVARQLEAEDFSIHTHTWTDATFLELLLHCRRSFEEAFEIEAVVRREMEVVTILRRAGGEPRPQAPASTAPELAAETSRLQGEASRLAGELMSAEHELRRVKRSPSWRVTEPMRAAKARLTKRS